MLYNSTVMSTEYKSFYSSGENGNAMIYVLIVVALMAALNFLLIRQNDTSEAGSLSEERLEIYAGNIITAASQLKQAVDMMTYSGTQISDLDFTTPDDEPAYSSGAHVDKVFHPEGGGVILPKIPADIINQVNNDPTAKWYIGRFNNVEWTESANQDVILTAHQLTQAVCAKINERLTGSSTIPTLTGAITLRNMLIDDGLHSGTNADFTAANCAGCEGWPQLCISNNGATIFSFYSVIAQE